MTAQVALALLMGLAPSSTAFSCRGSPITKPKLIMGPKTPARMQIRRPLPKLLPLAAVSFPFLPLPAAAKRMMPQRVTPTPMGMVTKAGVKRSAGWPTRKGATVPMTLMRPCMMGMASDTPSTSMPLPKSREPMPQTMPKPAMMAVTEGWAAYTSHTCGMVSDTAMAGQMMRATTLQMSQLFSQTHLVLRLNGVEKVPEKQPASRTSAIPM